MLKAAGAILVFFSCTALGIHKGMAVEQRLRHLEEIRKMAVLLLGEITYRREALPETLTRVSEKVREPFAGFLKAVAREAENFQGTRFSGIFEDKTETFLGSSGMNREDRKRFLQLGEYLGYMDVAVQKSTVELYLRELEAEICQAEKEKPVKMKLYRSLGVLGGIFLVLIMV